MYFKALNVTVYHILQEQLKDAQVVHVKPVHLNSDLISLTKRQKKKNVYLFNYHKLFASIPRIISLIICPLWQYLLLTWGSDSPLVPMVTSWYLDPDTSALLRRYSRKTFRPSYKTARQKMTIQAPTIPTTHYKTFKLEYHSGLLPFITCNNAKTQN